MDQSETSRVEFLGTLTKKERRVLGVLIEKSLTTPEYYPLTMKALETGCNQKSNRSPLSNYDEYDLEEILDKLRSRGLIASVQTAGGRTERYRHLLRDATGWGNKQLAIMGELLLRGRQQSGELRSRASRMAPLDSLDELRELLEKLMLEGYIQATSDLQRRGVEVDHALYLPEENKTLPVTQPGAGENLSADRDRPSTAEDTPRQPASTAAAFEPEQRPSASAPTSPASFQTSAAAGVQAEIPQQISDDLLELQDSVATLREQVQRLTDRIDELERQLGV